MVRTAWERAFNRVQREARLPGFRKGKVPRSMVKLHFADDVSRRWPAPDPRGVPAGARRDQARARRGAGPPGRPPGGRFAPLVLGGGGDQAHHHAGRLRRPRGEARAEAPHRRRGRRGDRPVARAARGVPRGGAPRRPGRPGDRGLHPRPEGMDPRTERGTASSSARARDAGDRRGGHRPAAGGTRATARCSSPTTTAPRRCAARPARQTVKVKEVKEKVLPVLDDEFAKTMGRFETLDALRAELRSELQVRRDRENRRALEDKVVEALAEHARLPGARRAGPAPGWPPDRAHARAAAPPGRRPGQAPLGLPEASRRSQPGAEKAVKRALLLEAIAEKEGLAPAEERGGRRDREDRPGQPAAGPRGAPYDGAERGPRRLRFRSARSRTLDLLIERAKIAP